MRSRRRGLILTLIIGVLGWASVKPQAQVTTLQTVSPFDVVGFIEAATVNPAPDGFSGGGTITVNGTVITVPTNTLLQMPAFALTWQEVFQQAPAPYGPAQSGLAMADVPRPLTTYEVHVQGNRVGDQYIAGLMFMAQQALNSGAGFINFIDYAKGEMRVGGLMGSAITGARVRINDPLGKFGPASHVDDRFTIDEDNPTVRSETAYPMCLPREAPGTVNPDGSVGDTRCPELNRPRNAAGDPMTIFTMDPADFPGSVIDPLLPTCTTSRPGAPRCNPLLMMPFEVGDYIDYNGNLTAEVDSTGAPVIDPVTGLPGRYVNAWGVIASVGVLTSPGSQPVYTAIDVMLLGTGGIPILNLPQEAAVRTRIEGFTTDPTQAVDLFATDVDACTGAQSLRYYASVGVDNKVVLGRWRWRPNTDLAFLPPTRMLTAISEGGIFFDPSSFTVATPDGVAGTPAGLLAGYYTAPNFDFIFAENLGIGNPPVPANFQDFPFLSSGSGPYPLPGSPAKLGQPVPWPGAVAPVQPTCPVGGTALFSPIADAGVDQSVAPFTTVTLDGGNSRDTTQPKPLPISFAWVQTEGVHVPLTGANAARPTFTAPGPLETPLPATLKFVLTVTNLAGGFSSSSVTVTVKDNPRPTDTVIVTSATFRMRRAQLTVTATTTDPTALLTVEGFGDMGPALAIAPGVPAPLTNRLYRQIGVDPMPTTVTVRSTQYVIDPLTGLPKRDPVTGLLIGFAGGIATLPVTVR